MNDTGKRFSLYTKQKGKEFEVLQLQAERLVLPDDILGLLDAWQQSAESLPSELETIRYAITRHLGFARHAYQHGDESTLRLYILRAQMNFENAKHDIWVLGVQKQFGKDAEHRRQQVKQNDEPRWQLWRDEAEKIKAEAVVKLSKTDMARRIKKRLALSESVDTIRKRI